MRSSSGRSFCAIPLRKTYEEALLRCQAIDGLQILILRCRLPRHVRQNFTAQVRDVLTQRQRAIDVHVVDDHVLGILIAHAAGALVEFFAVFLGPPIPEIALRIELAAFVVEAVRQFVPDRPSGVAVVRGIVHLGVIKWWLQNSGGKVDIVQLRVIVGVDGRRRDLPFAVINGLADLGDIASFFKLAARCTSSR